MLLAMTESLINDFLQEHYQDDPDFYKRTTDPIWSTTVPGNPGEPARFMKIFGQIMQPLVVDFAPTDDNTNRYQAWWRKSRGSRSTPQAPLPPNIIIKARVLLILNFTDRANPNGPGHFLDYQFAATVSAFISIQSEDQKPYLHATDWQIDIDSLGIDQNGLQVPPPGEVLGSHHSGDPTCEQELQDLRNEITDLFDFGAHYAISTLGSNLTVNLPLPPINISSGIGILPDQLVISAKTLYISGYVTNQPTSTNLSIRFGNRLLDVKEALSEPKIRKLVNDAPKGKGELDQWMKKNIPTYAKSMAKIEKFQTSSASKSPKLRQRALGAPELQIWINGKIFDALAKKYLVLDKDECRDILTIDVPPLIPVAHADLHACYGAHLSNPTGGIDQTTVFMQCGINVYATMGARVCLWTPCGDQCTSYDIGLGLNGPASAGLKVTSTNVIEDGGYSKWLDITFDKILIPGLYLIGLPPILSDVINNILNALTSLIFTAIVEAFLESIHIDVVEIPLVVPKTHVKMQLKNFATSAQNQYLSLGSDATFSKAP